MKEGMKEPYTEGVATHGDPEPCAGAREGVGEALDRGTCRRAIEPRDQGTGGRRRAIDRKATPRTALTRAGRGPRAVEEPGMYGTFMRENREIPTSTVAMVKATVRLGKAEAASPG